MGIFYKNEKRDLQYNEDDLQMMVQTLPGFQGTKLRQYKDIEAIRHSDIFTAVMMIASDLARMPIRVTVNGQINYSDRIVNLLNTRPNPMYNGYIFKLVVFVSALLTSHGYIEITRDKTGEPMNLTFRKTSEIELKSDARGRLYYFHQRIDSNGNNIERNVKFEDMLDIKFYSLDGINGLSLLDTLSRTIESDNNGKDFLNNFLRNGTHAGGILKMKGVLDKAVCQ
ncbi:phage portal protein [Staphylococcus aureus]